MRGFGAAQAVIPFKQLEVASLVAAIGDALSTKSDERLSRLADKIREEQGVDHAITVLEQYLG